MRNAIQREQELRELMEQFNSNLAIYNYDWYKKEEVALKDNARCIN